MLEGELTYTVDDKDLKVTQFMDLVQRVWPGEYNIEKIQAALYKTINITAWDKGELIGCVRILSDGYLFGTIPEILVLPNYQMQGIGKTLMELAWETTPTSLFIGSQPGNISRKCSGSRDSSITIPLQKFSSIDLNNRHYVTQEWQLLFKSKTPRFHI